MKSPSAASVGRDATSARSRPMPCRDYIADAPVQSYALAWCVTIWMVLAALGWVMAIGIGAELYSVLG
jgi:hypothetical protein